METILKGLHDFLSIELAVMVAASLPVVELKGAIPVGIALGMSPLYAAFVALVGSMIPVPIILYTVRPLFNYLKTTRFFRRTVGSLSERSINNSNGKIQKYGVWGLILFVAIPLPGTGVWSGSMAAALLNMRFKWAFPAILVGNLIAGSLIMGISDGIFKIFGR